MSHSPIKLPVDLMQQCEQALSHIQLASACGDADGAAKQAQKLIETARKLRDTFLGPDYPRCDKCAEPLTTVEAKTGDHCRKCAILLSLAAQVASISSRQQPPVSKPEPVAAKVVAEEAPPLKTTRGRKKPAVQAAESGAFKQLRLEGAVAK